MSNKPIVAVVMGGFSSERNISINSGRNIFNSINLDLFVPIKVMVNFNYWEAEIDGVNYPVDRETFSVNTPKGILTFDIVWNVIHGSPGENGILQGFLEILGVPYTGSGLYPMALSMNKHDCNLFLKNKGINVLPSFKINQAPDNSTLQKIGDTLGFPCIVKPNASGSSCGIGMARNLLSLAQEIKRVFKESDEIIIEKFQKGLEITSGIIEYKGELISLPLTEVFHPREFFEYEAKYDHSKGVKENTPALAIDATITKNIQNITLKVFELLQLKTHARADFIVQDSTPYFLEINTVPGMSDTSVLPQQIQCKGISMQDFITDNLISTLKQKHS